MDSKKKTPPSPNKKQTHKQKKLLKLLSKSIWIKHIILKHTQINTNSNGKIGYHNTVFNKLIA